MGGEVGKGTGKRKIVTRNTKNPDQNISGAQGRGKIRRLADLTVPGQAPHTGFLEHRVEKGLGDLLTMQCQGSHHTQAFWSTG